MQELAVLEFFGTKVLIATMCGLIVGWEREMKNKVAGIRTNVLICVGSCILTATSAYLCQNSSYDPTRIIGQIVTGIGFLGAGVIYKHEDKIVGVTTASFVWVMSSIGILTGLGFKIVPIVLTVGLLIVTALLQKLETKIKKK